ncbi:MAG TPA: hypothetical protein VMH27_06540 [Puia sp.]|nr:hypothetical protein [Puia sp.]
MSHKLALCLTAVCFLGLMASRAQTVDSLTGKLANLPSKWLVKVSSKSAGVNSQLTRQSESYVVRMARREQQLQQKLVAIDPGAAKALFGASQQEYAYLAARLRGDSTVRRVPLSGQYIPLADTLQGAMSFLQQNPQLLSATGNLSPKLQSRLQGAYSQFQLLQAKLQDANAVKAFVQSRRDQINQYITGHAGALAALGKPLAAMQKEEYYYSQRVAQYKAVLSDPDALAKNALGMLSQLPAFQNFMTTHSQLGSLFHVPRNYATAPNTNGIQTKEQVAQAVQNQLSGPASATAFQSSLQSAQSQLDDYKNKLKKLGTDNGDEQMPNFKPNDQKTKTFLKRLQYGFDFQATHYNNYYPALLSLGVSLGYKLGHSNVLGVGAAYELGTGNGINDVHLTSQGLGLRSFVNIKIKGTFSATGGFEYNHVTPFTAFQQLKQIQYWQRSGLIGVTQTISTKSKLLKQTTLRLLWDFLSYQNVPQTQPVIFRMGYNF